MARLMAKAIDLFIVLILSVFFHTLGLFLSAFYIGISDCLQNGQSVGKRFMGFQVISLEAVSYTHLTLPTICSV